VTFSGSITQNLNLATQLNSAAFTTAPSFTILVAARHTDAFGGEILSGDSSGGNQGIAFVIDGTNGNRQQLAKNNVVNIGTSTTASDTAFHLFEVTYDGATA